MAAIAFSFILPGIHYYNLVLFIKQVHTYFPGIREGLNFIDVFY